MTLLLRIFNEKRRIVLPLVIALAANIVIYLIAVYPLTRSVATAEQRYQLAIQQLRIARQRNLQARQIVIGKDRADQELRRFYEDVLPADLTGARRVTGLRLAQMAQQADLKYERRTVSAKEEKDSKLGKLTTTMVVAGAYSDVRRFIYQVETAPEFVVIEAIALQQGEEKGSPLVLTLNIATYYRAGGDGT